MGIDLLLDKRKLLFDHSNRVGTRDEAPGKFGQVDQRDQGLRQLVRISRLLTAGGFPRRNVLRASLAVVADG